MLQEGVTRVIEICGALHADLACQRCAGSYRCEYEDKDTCPAKIGFYAYFVGIAADRVESALANGGSYGRRE